MAKLQLPWAGTQLERPTAPSEAAWTVRTSSLLPALKANAQQAAFLLPPDPSLKRVPIAIPFVGTANPFLSTAILLEIILYDPKRQLSLGAVASDTALFTAVDLGIVAVELPLLPLMAIVQIAKLQQSPKANTLDVSSTPPNAFPATSFLVLGPQAQFAQAPGLVAIPELTVFLRHLALLSAQLLPSVPQRLMTHPIALLGATGAGEIDPP